MSEERSKAENLSNLKPGFVTGHDGYECFVTTTLDRVSECSCDQCQAWVEDGDETWMGGGRTDLVPALLGLCGCGAPDEIDQQFLAYLEGLAGWWAEVRAGGDPEQPYKLRMDLPERPEIDWLTAYLCDALGWTEHGGSVGGAWLTDEGERALANLRAALGGSPTEDPA